MSRPQYLYTNLPLTALVSEAQEGAGATIYGRVCESDSGYLPAAIGTLTQTVTTVTSGNYVVEFDAATLRTQLATYYGRRVFLHVTSAAARWYEVFPLTVTAQDPDGLPALLS